MAEAGRCAALAAVLVAVAAAGVWAQPPGVAEIQHLATHYHQDPARLDIARSELERATGMDRNAAILVSLARISYLWGDVRAASTEEKLMAYERGRRVASQALELEPGNVDARFWYVVNIGRWAETKGVFRALFLLPTIKQEIESVLALDPKYIGAYGFTGNLYSELPRVLGGDVDRAEQMFRKGIALDPSYTRLRLGLAKILIRTDRAREARHELERVLGESAPRNPAEWTLRERNEARRLLGTLKSDRP